MAFSNGFFKQELLKDPEYIEWISCIRWTFLICTLLWSFYTHLDISFFAHIACGKLLKEISCSISFGICSINCQGMLSRCLGHFFQLIGETSNFTFSSFLVYFLYLAIYWVRTGLNYTHRIFCTAPDLAGMSGCCEIWEEL